ncbi:probable serine/threonine-protein kinase DDB_G0280461 [Montipora foliosa]|uniref:probable serine/threonine-protein kinase DDB_G0280461 n=1 Tax=Montipora foliosa TaxID=591990 RepID=UPI0035F17155
MKEINPSEVAKSTKFLGCGSFGTCYLAYYRGIPVAVKEFRLRKSRSPDEIKKDVVREAQMIDLLGDHRGLPLLFGVITKSMLLRLITQFHGESDSCTTLYKEIKRKKTSWHEILKNVIKALNHMHDAGVIHNDLKSNNVVLEKREKEWNPVVIDFGKARHISNPKRAMDLSIFAQEEYRRSYPHIAPEIISGKGQQSKAFDVFSFGKIALKVLNLLPSESALSLNMAKKLASEDPAKRPRLNDFVDVLDTLA